MRLPWVGTTIKYKAVWNEKTKSYDAVEVGRGKSTGESLKFTLTKKDKEGGKEGCCICVLEMEGNEKNPLEPSAPGITYEVKIEIDHCARTYQWEVQHDAFPSHELWATPGKAIYAFDHREYELEGGRFKGSTPLHLFPPMEVSDSGDESY